METNNASLLLSSRPHRYSTGSWSSHHREEETEGIVGPFNRDKRTDSIDSQSTTGSRSSGRRRKSSKLSLSRLKRHSYASSSSSKSKRHEDPVLSPERASMGGERRSFSSGVYGSKPLNDFGVQSHSEKLRRHYREYADSDEGDDTEMTSKFGRLNSLEITSSDTGLNHGGHMDEGDGADVLRDSDRGKGSSDPKGWVIARSYGPCVCSVVLLVLFSALVWIFALTSSNTIDAKRIEGFNGWNRVGGQPGGTFYTDMRGPPSSCTSYSYKDSREDTSTSNKVFSPLVSDSDGNVYYITAITKNQQNGDDITCEPRLNQLDRQGDRIIDKAILPANLVFECPFNSIMVDLLMDEIAEILFVSVATTNYTEGKSKDTQIRAVGIYSMETGDRLSWFDFKEDTSDYFVPFRVNSRGSVPACKGTRCKISEFLLLGQRLQEGTDSGWDVELQSMYLKTEDGKKTVSSNWKMIIGEDVSTQLWDIHSLFHTSLVTDINGSVAVVAFPSGDNPKDVSLQGISVNLTTQNGNLLWNSKNGDDDGIIISNFAMLSKKDISYLSRGVKTAGLMYHQIDIEGNPIQTKNFPSFNSTSLHKGLLMARHPSNIIYCQPYEFGKAPNIAHEASAMGTLDSSGNIRWSALSIGPVSCTGYPLVDDIYAYFPVARPGQDSNTVFELQKRRIIDGELMWSYAFQLGLKDTIQPVSLAMTQYERIAAKTVSTHYQGEVGKTQLSVTSFGCTKLSTDRIWDEEFTFIVSALLLTFFIVRVIGGFLWSSLYSLASKGDVEFSIGQDHLVIAGISDDSPLIENSLDEYSSGISNIEFSYCGCYGCFPRLVRYRTRKCEGTDSDSTSTPNYGSALPFDDAGRCNIDDGADLEYAKMLKGGEHGNGDVRKTCSSAVHRLHSTGYELLSHPSASSYPWQFPVWVFYAAAVIIMVWSAALVSQKTSILIREIRDPSRFYINYLVDKSVSPTAECESVSAGACYCLGDSPKCEVQNNNCAKCARSCRTIMAETGNCLGSIFSYTCDCDHPTGCEHVSVSYNLTQFKQPGLPQNLQECRDHHVSAEWLVWGVAGTWLGVGVVLALLHTCTGIVQCRSMHERLKTEGTSSSDHHSMSGHYPTSKSALHSRSRSPNGKLIRSFSLGVFILLVVVTASIDVKIMSSAVSKGKVCTGDITETNRNSIASGREGYILENIEGCIFDSSWRNKDFEGDVVDAVGLAGGIQLLMAGILLADWLLFSIQAAHRQEFHSALSLSFRQNLASRMQSHQSSTRLIVSPRVIMLRRRLLPKLVFCCPRQTNQRSYGRAWMCYCTWLSCICCGPSCYEKWLYSQRGINNPYFIQKPTE